MSIEELNNEEQYEKVLELKHDELIPFIQSQYQNKTNLLLGYLWINIGIVVVMLILGGLMLSSHSIRFSSLLLNFFIGVFGSFSLLIIFHEWLHGLAYKWMGAPKISYGGNIRKFYFYAAADGFVVNKQQLDIIALTPFVVISSLSLLGLVFLSAEYKWISLGVLFAHTAMCGGDFGMINYMKLHEQQEMYTYDDLDNKVSYFFIKKEIRP